jgi:hypothetical protein
VWHPVLSRVRVVCVRPCGCVWFVCVVVSYCYVAGSYPVFLLNGMKRSSPAFSRKIFNHLDIHFIEYK